MDWYLGRRLEGIDILRQTLKKIKIAGLAN